MTQRLHNRLYVALPVCEVCHRVGKIPQHGMGNSMKEYCVGEITRKHPKQKMSTRLFVESRAKVKADA